MTEKMNIPYQIDNKLGMTQKLSASFYSTNKQKINSQNVNSYITQAGLQSRLVLSNKNIQICHSIK